jgi:hypothetical protein
MEGCIICSHLDILRFCLDTIDNTFAGDNVLLDWYVGNWVYTSNSFQSRGHFEIH